MVSDVEQHHQRPQHQRDGDERARRRFWNFRVGKMGRGRSGIASRRARQGDRPEQAKAVLGEKRREQHEEIEDREAEELLRGRAGRLACRAAGTPYRKGEHEDLLPIATSAKARPPKPSQAGAKPSGASRIV